MVSHAIVFILGKDGFSFQFIVVLLLPGDRYNNFNLKFPQEKERQKNLFNAFQKKFQPKSIMNNLR